MKISYWNNNGKYQALVSDLQKLIPTEGAIPDAGEHKELETFRIASNCYYDLYNDGLMNCASKFRKVFGIASSKYQLKDQEYDFSDSLYELTEAKMDEIIWEAAVEEFGISYVHMQII